jgi:hypothetical protein
MHERRRLPIRWAIPLSLVALVLLSAATAADGTEEAARHAQIPSPRLYAPTSPLNLPVPTGAAVDPRSEAMIAQLVREVGAKGWAISSREYTIPLFRASARTKPVSVHVRTRGTTHRVPIPPAAFPSPGSDGHLVVIDPRKGCEYDFYRARRLPDGSWEAENFNALPTDASGIYPRGLATRASGFANAAGLISAAELARGRIEHALVFTMAATRAGGPVPPASSSDGQTSGESTIPEGARLQLDPALSLESLQPWQRVIARALQRYGMYLADTGGAVALFAQHPDSAPGFRYPWGNDVDYGYLPSWLARHLRVLELPPQRRSVHRFVPNRCLTRP